ncbi:MAG: histidine phosphatase family protein [Patescibacteria group bacterium]
MTMPIDLVLVRHGQSEWNVAQHRSRQGDHSLFTPEFRERHSSTARLTPKGCEQAQRAGEWLREHFTDKRFHRHYASPYVRTMETAAHLGLPNVRWYMNLYLRERDGGDLEGLTDEERTIRYERSLKTRNAEPFYWTPPNGESVATICARVDRVLDTLHRTCSDKRVLIILHGEMMWAFRVRLERLSSHRFAELQTSTDPKDRINNCQILHYTREAPSDSSMSDKFEWMRSINPWDLTTSRNEWEVIQRTTYSNDDLLTLAEAHPRLFSE